MSRFVSIAFAVAPLVIAFYAPTALSCLRHDCLLSVQPIVDECEKSLASCPLQRTLLGSKWFAYEPALVRTFVTLNAGDIIVGSTTLSPYSKWRSIIGVDPSSGDRTIISDDAVGSGAATGDLQSLDYDRMNDRILAVDSDNLAVVSINPLNGLKTVISDNVSKGTGVIFSSISAIAVASDGQKGYVVDDAADAIVEVDLATGNRTTISDNLGTGGGLNFATPSDIVLSADDSTAYVANQAGASIFSVNLADGNRTDIASDAVGSGTVPVEPTRLTLDPDNNRLFVMDDSLTGVMTVDLTSGSRTVQNTVGALTTTVDDVAYDRASGLVYVVRFYPHTVIAMDPSTYSAVILSE